MLNNNLKFSCRIFDNNDPYVQKVAIRQAISKKISKDFGVDKILWHESSGITGVNTSAAQGEAEVMLMPGLELSLSAGFEANRLLWYRFARPMPEQAALNAEHATPVFPISLSLARQMPIGHEIELRGQVRLKARPSFGFGVQGISMSLAAKESLLGEYSLSVLALDGQKRVRITIAQLNQENALLSYKLRTSILDFLGLASLKNLSQEEYVIQIQKIIDDYSSLVAQQSISSITKHKSLHCFDLDLSNQDAQNMYERLMGFNFDEIIEPSKEAKGIEIIRFHERENKSSLITDFQAFSQKLFLHEISEIEGNGVILTPHGSQAVYCESIYADKFESLVFGSREVRWQGVEIMDDDNKPQKYYRFFYEQLANMPQQSEVNKFFWLADKLNIKSSCALRSKLIAMNSLEKLASCIDDTKANIEIFFTDSGVNILQAADAKTGFLAFQAANAAQELSPELQTRVNQLLESYHDLHLSWLSWLRFGDRMRNLIFRYERFLQRDFFSDYSNFLRAKQFGSLVANFVNANKKEHARDFFAFLGKSGSFEYEEILVALAHIVGRENILVHKLSMKGGNINIISIDEGEIQHPQDRAQKLLARAQPYQLV